MKGEGPSQRLVRFVPPLAPRGRVAGGEGETTLPKPDNPLKTWVNQRARELRRSRLRKNSSYGKCCNLKVSWYFVGGG